jgi:cation transporter-like permease
MPAPTSARVPCAPGSPPKGRPASSSCSIGLLFPWGLKRLGFDPAYGSGPSATIVQDVCTILIYFAVVWLFAL